MEDPVSKISKDIKKDTIELTIKATSMQDQVAPPILLPDSKLGQAAQEKVSIMLSGEQNEL
jgi:hypothetical protein